MIRLATIADVASIAALIRRYDPPAPGADAWCRELVRTGVVLLSADCSTALEMAIDTSREIETSSTIVGALALRRDRWGWNGRAFLRDNGFLCFDGSGRQLVRAAVVIARRMGLPLYLGQSSGERVAALARLYRSEGGEIVGSVACWKPAAPGAV